MRLMCRVFGCAYDDHCSCPRCGEDLYSGMFIQIGWLNPIYNLIHKWKMNRKYRYHPCEVCGHPMYFSNDYCCSKECYDDWIPF